MFFFTSGHFWSPEVTFSLDMAASDSKLHRSQDTSCLTKGVGDAKQNASISTPQSHEVTPRSSKYGFRWCELHKRYVLLQTCIAEINDMAWTAWINYLKQTQTVATSITQYHLHVSDNASLWYRNLTWSTGRYEPWRQPRHLVWSKVRFWKGFQGLHSCGIHERNGWCLHSSRFLIQDFCWNDMKWWCMVPIPIPCDTLIY